MVEFRFKKMQKDFSFSKIFFEFFILGLYSFGGPTAHIGFFQEKFVKRKKWLSEKKIHGFGFFKSIPARPKF